MCPASERVKLCFFPLYKGSHRIREGAFFGNAVLIANIHICQA